MLTAADLRCSRSDSVSGRSDVMRIALGILAVGGVGSVGYGVVAWGAASLCDTQNCPSIALAQAIFASGVVEILLALAGLMWLRSRSR